MPEHTSPRLVVVAVLLGDPRLPYAYAIEACFGAEEREAVEQFKTALEALQGVTFAYLDDLAGIECTVGLIRMLHSS